MRLAIVGSRNYNDYDTFKHKVLEIIATNDLEVTTIVSGGAKGVDSMARIFSKELNVELIEHLPKYKGPCDHSRSKCYPCRRIAPLERNTLIVQDCDVMIAFVTKESRGTWDSIRKQKAGGNPLFIIHS